MYSRKLFLTLSLIMTGWSFAANVWSAEAGRVQFVHGVVQLSDSAGRLHVLKKGDSINEGDSVISASSASAQIKMMDGGFIAVRPDTRLKFDSFKFAVKADEPQSSFFSLFKGGFRAITGLIGKLRKQDYRITTPTATIGIRGTDHETVMVLPDNPLVLAGKAESGTYNKVNSGETSIATDKGAISVLPNQMGFAGSQQQMPKILPVNINLFTVAPPPPPGAKIEQDGQDGETPRESAVVDNTAQAAASDTTAPAGARDSVSALPTSIAPPSVVVSVTQNIATFPAQVAGGIGLFFQEAGGIKTTGGGGIIQATPTASGGLGAFTTNATMTTCIANCAYNVGFQSGSIGTAALLDQGGNALAGNLRWGRWFGQGATVTGLPAGATLLNGNLIYIGGDIPTMPISGIASYVPVGGTAPVDSAGKTGQFLGANISVNFGTLSLVVSNMQVAFGGGTYTMSSTAANGNFLANGGVPSIPISGGCTGTCASTTLKGDVAGSFTGVNAAGLALAYHIANGTVGTGGAAPTFEIMGSQGFIKQ